MEAVKHPEYFGFDEKDWDNVNVFMYETISPESFPSFGTESVQSFFQLDRKTKQIDSNRMRNVISNTQYKTYLNTSQIDAYIIFVNTGSFFTSPDPSYLGTIMGYKNGIPVHYLIINTRIERSIADYNFLDQVQINRIGRLLPK